MVLVQVYQHNGLFMQRSDCTAVQLLVLTGVSRAWQNIQGVVSYNYSATEC
jgi:hypothetical protein